jgi:hypothetical protein
MCIPFRIVVITAFFIPRGARFDSGKHHCKVRPAERPRVDAVAAGQRSGRGECYSDYIVHTRASVRSGLHARHWYCLSAGDGRSGVCANWNRERNDRLHGLCGGGALHCQVHVFGQWRNRDRQRRALQPI